MPTKVMAKLRERKTTTPIITADAATASRYIPAPVVMPAVMDQNR